MEKQLMENQLLMALSLIHRVDLDAQPFVPAGCSIKEHRKGGKVNIERITFYSSKRVKPLKEVLTDVDGELFANATFLDYLVCNKGLIPDIWKGLKIIFGGTIYENFKGELFVRCLSWDNGFWEWSFYSLDGIFSKDCVLVLL